MSVLLALLKRADMCVALRLEDKMLRYLKFAAGALQVHRKILRMPETVDAISCRQASVCHREKCRS